MAQTEMDIAFTVIFADLTGSTSMFESLGTEKATQAITKLTQAMGETCTVHDACVVKMLGDGVLALFAREVDAVDAMLALQRGHQTRTAHWPPRLMMQIKIGAAHGEIVEVEGDCFGEAVNLASRLCDLAGPGEIWVTKGVIDALPSDTEVRFRGLGPIRIRGLVEPREVYRIDWNRSESSELMTLPASLGQEKNHEVDPLLGRIELSWMDANAAFSSVALPIYLGRMSDAEFAVNDPRVSRRHARIDWVDDHFVLTDLSSYGTWVRMGGSPGELALRRGECVLMGQGEISLGAPFGDPTAPTVSFKLSDGAVSLEHHRTA